MRKLKKSRRELFLALDAPNALPLPERPYEFDLWKKARVNVDYHIEVEGHYYSVPYPLVHQVVEVRLTAGVVEVMLKGNRVASHPRSTLLHCHTTNPEHMPASHRHHAEWTPSRLIGWAKKTGPHTGELVEAILSSRKHPEQGYRSTLGILRLERHYGAERLEKAAERALRFRSLSFRSVKQMLERGLDQEPFAPEEPAVLPPHENIRGSRHYQQFEGGADHA